MGMAVAIEYLILRNVELTTEGGISPGLVVDPPKFFGIPVDKIDHPDRYATLCLALLVVMLVLVANLRRGRSGRRMVAVRTNERAAASLGISVFGAKLFAFGLAAAIAGLAGTLLAFTTTTIIFYQNYGTLQSINAVVYAVIGGIGFVIGPLFGSTFGVGTLGPKFIEDVLGGDVSNWFQIIGGFGLISILMQNPNGLTEQTIRQWRTMGRWLQVNKFFADRPHPPLPEVTREHVAPKTLELRDVTVNFGGVVALKDSSLEVRPGEVLGLIGPNGAGKTTLIDAATGFVRPRSGHVMIDGREITKLNARQRARLGMTRSFQSLELFEDMTVRDNLRTACDRRDPMAYLSDLVRPGDPPLSPAAVAAVREFGLEADLERKPGELPYGRRRLVGIARAVATEPSILMLDEPAAGLDDNETNELGDLIRRLADDWGIAILLVEHDVSLVLRVLRPRGRPRLRAHHRRRHARRDPHRPRRHRGLPRRTRRRRCRRGPRDAGRGRRRLGGRRDGRANRAVERDRRPAGDHVTAAPLIETRKLSAGYGGVPAVRDLDISVSPGEIVALLGPNGAGKTTTLLTLAGELRPIDGEVLFEGTPTKAPLHRRAKRGVALVTEERSVFMGLTTAANLRLGQGDPAKALELFPELEKLMRRRAGLLSGGEQQILTLARALAAEPKLLLADELSLGLAPLVVQRLLRSVRTAVDERGLGVLLVEQHALQALKLADRAYVLRRGRVVLEGPAAELLDRLGEIEESYLAGPSVN